MHTTDHIFQVKAAQRRSPCTTTRQSFPPRLAYLRDGSRKLHIFEPPLFVAKNICTLRRILASLSPKEPLPTVKVDSSSDVDEAAVPLLDMDSYREGSSTGGRIDQKSPVDTPTPIDYPDRDRWSHSSPTVLEDPDLNGMSLYDKKCVLINREIDAMGMGRYQWYIWTLCGFGYMLDLLVRTSVYIQNF